LSAVPSPLEGFYAWGMRRRRTANLARRATAELLCPIISIGNLTAGGTGKTPAVIWLASYLGDQGRRIAVVSRGHGGTASDQGAIVSRGSGPLLSAAEAGDEPVLHSRRLSGVSAVIGRDRALAVHRAVSECGAEIVVLDDGYQYWSLPRTVDIVLLDARAPFGNGKLLPVGRLREEPDALDRANAILLTRADLATEEQMEDSRRQIAHFSPAPVYTCSHRPLDLLDEATGQITPLSSLADQRVVLVSALAANDSFRTSAEKLGARVLTHVARRDHYKWSARDFRRLPAEADMVVTTEKDAVKLDPAWFGTPLHSLRIGLDLGQNEMGLRNLIDHALLKNAK